MSNLLKNIKGFFLPKVKSAVWRLKNYKKKVWAWWKFLYTKQPKDFAMVITVILLTINLICGILRYHGWSPTNVKIAWAKNIDWWVTQFWKYGVPILKDLGRFLTPRSIDELINVILFFFIFGVIPAAIVWFVEWWWSDDD